MGWVVNARPCRFTVGKDQAPIASDAGPRQGWSRQVQKISSPPGFGLWAV
jgi:hypothetical protein